MNFDFSEYKYKIEAHCHTSPVSTCANFPPEEVVKTYKSAGVDAVVITNHFMKDYLPNPKEEAVSYYMKDFEKAFQTGKKLGINVILGMEIRFSNENNNDYMIYGIDESFVQDAYEMLGGNLEDFYKKMKNNKNLIIQAHPFRRGMELANPRFTDGAEAFNMHLGQNSAVAQAYKYAASNPNFIITAGSDYHHLNHEATGLILSKKLPANSFEFAEILKSKDYLFSLGGCVALPYSK